MKAKKYILILALCLFIILVITLITYNYTNNYLKQINYSTFKDKIKNTESFILYVGNKSCTYCQKFQPTLENVVNEYKVFVYKIDTATLTTDEYDEFTDLLGNISTPTVLFFYDGEESGIINRINGNVSKEVVINKFKINKYIKD